MSNQVIPWNDLILGFNKFGYEGRGILPFLADLHRFGICGFIQQQIHQKYSTDNYRVIYIIPDKSSISREYIIKWLVKTKSGSWDYYRMSNEQVIKIISNPLMNNQRQFQGARCRYIDSDFDNQPFLSYILDEIIPELIVLGYSDAFRQIYSMTEYYSINDIFNLQEYILTEPCFIYKIINPLEVSEKYRGFSYYPFTHEINFEPYYVPKIEKNILDTEVVYYPDGYYDLVTQEFHPYLYGPISYTKKLYKQGKSIYPFLELKWDMTINIHRYLIQSQHRNLPKIARKIAKYYIDTFFRIAKEKYEWKRKKQKWLKVIVPTMFVIGLAVSVGIMLSDNELTK